jgi:hypothetical protein
MHPRCITHDTEHAWSIAAKPPHRFNLRHNEATISNNKESLSMGALQRSSLGLTFLGNIRWSSSIDQRHGDALAE